MLKILVAEDDVSTNKLLCAILKINGYEAIPAFNGEAALDISTTSTLTCCCAT